MESVQTEKFNTRVVQHRNSILMKKMRTGKILKDFPGTMPGLGD
jgi:hypothetical protein